MKQWVKKYLVLLLVLMLCAGCGKTPGNSEPGMSEDNAAVGSEEQEPEVSVTGEDSVSSYRVERTISLELEDPDEEFKNKTLYSGSYGSTLYLLASYQFEGDKEPARWIYIFDLETQETVKLPFSLETPGMENPHVNDMFVTGQDELTLRLYGSLEGRESSAYLYRTDLTGQPLDQEEPFTEDMGQIPETSRFFAVTDGSPILLASGASMTSDLLRYDIKNQSSAPLTTVSGIVTALCSDGQDGLYYVNSDQLRHLNLKDMTDESLGRTAEFGIKQAIVSCLLCDSEGKLALCLADTGNPTVYLLTDQEEAIERETIRMARLTSYDYIFQMADEWSAKSDKYRIIREEVPFEEERKASSRAEEIQMREPLRTRIMAELVSGKGPELMYVSEDDMHLLAEKGALMDLAELIPEDIQEQLLPGLRPLGTVDGTWVGITENVFFYTLMTPDDLWSKDSWTVSDLLDLAESRDDWDWIISEPWFDAVTDYNALFERGFAMSLGDSPFLDVEKGISYFNGEEFIRTLEFCKKYGQSGDVSVGYDETIRSMMEEGKSIARRIYLFGGLNDFSEAVTAFEGCHMVGFPSEKGNGNYLYSNSYLVVNAKAEHIDAIKDYIAYILSYEEQFFAGDVRKDVPRDQISVHPQTGDPALLHNPSDPDNGFSYSFINFLKPDGTTYIEEYMKFIESCVPIPYCPDAINEIVKEELGAYFNGNKSAKDTAEIIHRRVQLYFDERN